MCAVIFHCHYVYSVNSYNIPFFLIFSGDQISIAGDLSQCPPSIHISKRLLFSIVHEKSGGSNWFLWKYRSVLYQKAVSVLSVQDGKVVLLQISQFRTLLFSQLFKSFWKQRNKCLGTGLAFTLYYTYIIYIKKNVCVSACMYVCIIILS